MATINLNDAMAWLKKMEERSNINQQRFEARPSVPASQAWSGYQDKPGGQRLMVRQMQRPEIDNTLTVKNDGTQTLVKKWKDPDQSNVKATALPPGRSGSLLTMLPPPRNQRNPFDIPQYGFPTGGLSPEAQAAIAQVRATGGQNVDGHGNPIGPNLQNYRVMHNAATRPRPLVVGEEPRVSAWQSIMDRLNASREEIQKRREQETMAPFDLFHRLGWRNN